jgi:hypothetical protein
MTAKPVTKAQKERQDALNMKFLVISTAVSESQSIFLVNCDGVMNFTLAGTYFGFGELSPNGGFAKTLQGETVCYKQTYQSFCKGEISHTSNGASADWLRWDKLMNLCPHLETDVQMWEVEVDEKLRGMEFFQDEGDLEFIPTLRKAWDDWNWATYVAHCFPKFLEYFGKLDPYEGIKILRHEVSEGNEVYQDFEIKILDRGYNRLWVGGSEIYSEVWHREPDFTTKASHSKLAEFSRKFTNSIYSPEYSGMWDENLIYLDTSGRFKTRAKINIDESSSDWEGSISSIDNGFGSWEGFPFHPNHAFWFESCNGNALRAVPTKDGDYEIAIFRDPKRNSCSYQEFFS